MKKAIVRITLIITAGALLVFFVSSLLWFNYLNRKAAAENVRKLAVVFVQNVNDRGVTEGAKVPEKIDAGTRVTVTSKDGKVVLFDNMENVSSMNDHSTRPEIIAAIAGEPKAAIRYSSTLKKQMVYYAERATSQDMGEVVVRVAVPLAESTNFLMPSAIVFATIIAGVILLAVALSEKLAKSVIAPISNIKDTLLKIDGGTVEKLPRSKYEEIDGVICGVNEVSEKLSTTLSSLQTEKNKLYFVLDNMQEAIIALDRKNEIVLINRYARRIFDVDSGLMGKHINYLTDDAQILQNFKFGSEDKVLKLEYAERSYLSHISSLRDFSLTVLIMTDITEERELEKVKSRFFENASHELKTPVTSIKGFSELLKNDENVSAESKTYIDIMSREIDRLLAIIEDMMTLSRLENREVEKKEEPQSLKAVCEEIFERVTPQAKRLNLTMELEGDLVVTFDKQQLSELLTNLIDNAVKYNREGGSVKVSVSGKKLSVKDTGIGIEQKHLSRIFERFYRVEKGRSRKAGGTGLGLAIVKHIAINNNVQIAVKSRPGSGTEIVLTF